MRTDISEILSQLIRALGKINSEAGGHSGKISLFFSLSLFSLLICISFHILCVYIQNVPVCTSTTSMRSITKLCEAGAGRRGQVSPLCHRRCGCVVAFDSVAFPYIGRRHKQLPQQEKKRKTKSSSSRIRRSFFDEVAFHMLEDDLRDCLNDKKRERTNGKDHDLTNGIAWPKTASDHQAWNIWKEMSRKHCRNAQGTGW